ncbi:MAG: regulatory protein RecX [Archangiaceae bacterium]|nr:regulatory protein RecX [Archangiaceae bacterium]
MAATAFDTAVKLLEGRPKSRARLEAALVQRGFAARDIAQALARVTELGYLDDRRHAEARARAGVAEGRSVPDVERRLEAEGIDPALAAEVTEAVAREAGYDELSAARALVQRRKVSGAKAARLLASRGFSDDVVETVSGLGAFDD